MVTGAGGGIGRAHALRLATLGAVVVVNDLGAAIDGTGSDVSRAVAVVDEIEAIGGRAVADTGDVASITGGRRVIERAIAEFGRIDIVVNNAGFAAGGGTVEHPDEGDLDRLIDVHLKAAIGTMSVAIEAMRERGWGRIINTVSEASLDPRFIASFGYSAAKAAVWSVTLAAAAETAGSGITVNAISPGARTRLNADLLDRGFRDGTSRGLDLDPGHVADVVAYLASDDAADISGRIIHAAGGQIREYTTMRASRGDLVDRLRQALSQS